MAVFRVERTRDYTVMSNYHLKDTGLTLKAKGLLSMMLSLPDEWNYTTRGLASICKESVETIGKTLRELESAGYLTRRQLRGKNGRITDTEYTIFEKPVKPQPEPAPPDTASPGTENPDMVNPDMETPDMAVPDTENPPQLNTKKSNIQKSNTHGSNTHSFFPSAPAAAETDGQTEVMEKREEIRDQIEYEHMIFAQRPDATACAEYDLWNDTMRRYVRRGSKGIALVDNSREKPRLRYVFDISDTGLRMRPSMGRWHNTTPRFRRAMPARRPLSRRSAAITAITAWMPKPL